VGLAWRCEGSSTPFAARRRGLHDIRAARRRVGSEWTRIAEGFWPLFTSLFPSLWSCFSCLQTFLLLPVLILAFLRAKSMLLHPAHLFSFPPRSCHPGHRRQAVLQPLVIEVRSSLACYLW